MAQGQEVVVPEGGSSGGFSIEITLKPLTKRSYRKAGTMSNIRSALVKGDRGEEMPRQTTTLAPAFLVPGLVSGILALGFL